MQALPESMVGLRSAYENQQKQFSRAFAVLRDAIQQQAFPGAALAVTHRGQLVASEGFGNFTYDESAPVVTRDTVFDLASLTKVVATTSMAMLLFERGVLG
ncbi:MAG TPA: serine hydrolase domain-containing protein, partial [Tepidisphaeraceae bacterium]|nr:serine hydrolase domain-containing protein [Tepidisphaeraceae bacterium]